MKQVHALKCHSRLPVWFGLVYCSLSLRTGEGKCKQQGSYCPTHILLMWRGWPTHMFLKWPEQPSCSQMGIWTQVTCIGGWSANHCSKYYRWTMERVCLTTLLWSLSVCWALLVGKWSLSLLSSDPLQYDDDDWLKFNQFGLETVCISCPY